LGQNSDFLFLSLPGTSQNKLSKSVDTQDVPSSSCSRQQRCGRRTGQLSLIVATSADHSAAAVAGAGDNGNYNDKANKPLPRARTDADGGGRR